MEVTFYAALNNSCNSVIFSLVDNDTYMTEELMSEIVKKSLDNFKKYPQFTVHPNKIRQHVTEYILKEFGSHIWYPS